MVRGDRVRVLFMIDSLGPGGAEQTLARIVTRIDRDRFEPRVAVLQAREGNPAAGPILDAGIPVDEVVVDRLRSLRGHSRVLRYLATTKPDVIHTHLEFSHTLGGFYGRILGIPPVATVHAFAEGRHSREENRLSLMWWSLRRAHRIVIAPSEAGRDHVRAAGRVPESRLVVMHNGVDLVEYRPHRVPEVRAALGISEDSSLIVTVAVLRKEKGLADLVSAMPEIVSGAPDAVAIVVGDGPERHELERRVVEAGMSERVHLLGRREDVSDLLAAADLFVLPTHQDVLPTVVAEAMASGLPVVATEVGGLGEMVADGATGLLYEPGDIAALTERCVRLLTQRESARGMGDDGRRRAEEVFDLGAQVRRLEGLYEQVSS